MIVTEKLSLVGTPDGRETWVGKDWELVQETAKLKLWTPNSEWSYH